MKLFAAGFATATVLFVGLILAAYYRSPPAGEESTTAVAATEPRPTTPNTSAVHLPALPPLPRTQEPPAPVSVPSTPPTRAPIKFKLPLLITEAKSLLSDAGFKYVGVESRDDGSSVTTYANGDLKYQVTVLDRRVAGVGLVGLYHGDGTKELPEFKRVAGIMVRRATGEPMPDGFASVIGVAEEKTVSLGDFDVGTFQFDKKGMKAVGVAVAPAITDRR